MDEDHEHEYGPGDVKHVRDQRLAGTIETEIAVCRICGDRTQRSYKV